MLHSGHVALRMTVSGQQDSSSFNYSQDIHVKTESWPGRLWHLKGKGHSQMYFSEVRRCFGTRVD
jgi:hypothetical protein